MIDDFFRTTIQCDDDHIGQFLIKMSNCPQIVGRNTTHTPIIGPTNPGLNRFHFVGNYRIFVRAKL